MDASEIISLTTSVTKKWAKQRKSEEKQASRAYSRRCVLTRRCRITIKDVAWEVMGDAYLKASSGGRYPAHARQIMYAARPQILAKADRTTLDDAYFTQQLLPDYMREHGEAANWDVVFDARGHLSEPHTNKEVALGTLDVRTYLTQVKSHTVGAVSAHLGNGLFPTMGPANRYGAILFIEKEGFMPLFRKAQLAERYDISIMSTKGMSTTAARELVDRLCDADVPLFVLHDFDKAGFSILTTLQKDTRRYTFSTSVNVVDLGLRLSDVHEWNLQSEQCTLGKGDPTWNLRENGATEKEIAFLCTGSNYHGYSGQRVELNAFSSGDLLKWIERKLQQQGIKKLVPDGHTLEAAYRRATLTKIVNEQIEPLIEAAREDVDVMKISSKRIERDIKRKLREHPTMSWDQAITHIVGANDEC